MQIHNKTDYLQTIELVGDSGDVETLSLQPRGTVEIPEGFTLAREYNAIKVFGED